MKKAQQIVKENLASVFLVIATFLNPLGFDVAFYSVMKLTGSYWITTGIFYLGSACFFGLFFWLRKRDRKKPNQKEIKLHDADEWDNWHNHH
jgi:hypothetical protein